MNLDYERSKLELIKVSAAKSEMEFKVLEKLEEIERIKKNIHIQEECMKKLNEKIKSMEA